jgi:hypothetical protein
VGQLFFYHHHFFLCNFAHILFLLLTFWKAKCLSMRMGNNFNHVYMPSRTHHSRQAHAQGTLVAPVKMAREKPRAQTYLLSFCWKVDNLSIIDCICFLIRRAWIEQWQSRMSHIR